jgi:putative ABC transport system permease protein
VTAVLGPLFGLAPALLMAKVDLISGLRERGGRWMPKRSPFRAGTIMIAGQIAVSTLLTSSALLLAGSFDKLLHAPRGFDPEHVLTAQINLPPASYPQRSPKVAAFYSELLRRLRENRQISAVSAAEILPLSGETNGTSVTFSEHPEDHSANADLRFVEPDYFRVLRIALVAGRLFSAADTPNARPCALVNQAFARRFFGSESALGRTLSLGWGGSAPKTIVGVVADIRHSAGSAEVVPEVYVPFAQFPLNDMTLLVRSEMPLSDLTSLLRREVGALDPGVPVDRIRSLPEYRLLSASPQRFVTFVLLFFAAASTLLAAVGLYGTLSYHASLREREFGIRLALGSGKRDLMYLVLRQAGTLTLAGMLAGLILSAAYGGLLRHWLYDTSPANLVSRAEAALILILAAFLAAWLPARRATRVDPLDCLRAD